jgi:hypothetical protein
MGKYADWQPPAGCTSRAGLAGKEGRFVSVSGDSKRSSELELALMFA